MKLSDLYRKLNVLPALIVITYILLVLDTLKYPGFVGKHLFIDARVFFATSVVLLFLRPVTTGIQWFIFKTGFAVMAGVTLFYIWFSILEATHFTNYVLSKYHFSLEGLVYVFMFSVVVYISSKLRSTILSNINGRLIWQGVVFFLVAYASVLNIGVSLKNAVEGDLYVFTHLSASYDQKMYYQWHGFYFYMLFIKNNTPENASIVIPPQIAPWWTSSGNLSLVRYFLYPRTVIQYNTPEIPDLKSLHRDTYIMIAWGEWGCDRYGCGGWPIQIIKAREAIFEDTDSSGVKDIKQNFVYDPRDTANPFGLLKI